MMTRPPQNMSRVSRRRRGYTLGVVLALLAVLTIMMASSFAITTRQGTESNRFLAQAYARTAASSALERFYATLSSTDTAATSPSVSLKTWVADPTPNCQLGLLSALQDVYLVSDSLACTEPQTWYALDTTLDTSTCSADRGTSTDFGCRLPCTTSSLASAQACYRIWWSHADGQNIVVTAVGRSGCVTAGGSTCQFARISQRIERQKFLDYLLYTKYTAMDPAQYSLAGLAGPVLNVGETYDTKCGDKTADELSSPPSLLSTPTTPGCEVVAFTSADSTKMYSPGSTGGDIMTSDSHFWSCGTPSLGTVAVVNTYPQPAVDSSPTCSYTTAATPDRVEYKSITEANILPQSNCTTSGCSTNYSTWKSADLQASGALVISGTPVTLAFSKTGVRVNSATTITPMPQNGVIYADQGAAVSVSNDTGVPWADQGVAGTVSIFTTGTIHITGDLTYNDAAPSSTPLATDPPCTLQPSTSKSVIGLNAGTIILDNDPTSPKDHLCVQAVLVSLDHAIYTDNWWQPTTAPAGGYTSKCDTSGTTTTNVNVPVLYFYGAMVAKYQPIMTSYDGNATTPSALGGYSKCLYHDTRFNDQLLQPPHLLTPSTATWRRLDQIQFPGVNPGDDV